MKKVIIINDIFDRCNEILINSWGRGYETDTSNSFLFDAMVSETNILSDMLLKSNKDKIVNKYVDVLVNLYGICKMYNIKTSMITLPNSNVSYYNVSDAISALTISLLMLVSITMLDTNIKKHRDSKTNNKFNDGNFKLLLSDFTLLTVCMQRDNELVIDDVITRLNNNNI